MMPDTEIEKKNDTEIEKKNGDEEIDEDEGITDEAEDLEEEQYEEEEDDSSDDVKTD